MPLFRRGIPRRALLGAVLGFAYSLVILLRGELLTATGWALLAVGVLFARPFTYYAYLTWAVLWIAWRGTLAFQGRVPVVLWAVVDVVVPVVSLVLLSSSGYIEAVQEPDDEPSVRP